MKMIRKNLFRLLTLLVFCSLQINAIAQGRIEKLKNDIEIKKVDIPALDEKIEISVDEVELEEFLRGIGTANRLNISVDPSLQLSITNNFVDVSVADILVFLAEKHSLKIEFIGNIISVTTYVEKKMNPIVKEPDYAIYSQKDDRLTIDAQDIPLKNLVKEITSESNRNVLAKSILDTKIINAYINNMPFQSALEKLAFTNELELTVTGDGFFIFGDKAPIKEELSNPKRKQNDFKTNFEYDIKNKDNISVNAIKTPIIDVLGTISNKLGINYFLLSEPDEITSLNIKNFTYEQFLEFIFKSSNFTYSKKGDLFLIGERGFEDLRNTRVIELQYRSVDKISEFIPNDIKKGVSIREYPELNSVILSGSAPNIIEIESFLDAIDKIVPVVLIEVLIIDYSHGHLVSTGINAGIGESPAPSSQGSIYPNLNYNLDANSVNDLVESLNGFGWFKLGKVTPNFYLQIQALEEQGALKVRSTPKLATLNGNEANLTIGTTEYYAVSSNNVIGSQNPQNIITTNYQSVNADLKMTIKPYVSGNEQITLDISVEQSSFTARIPPEAPPGSITRSFSSLIRVKNEEMILLGGLENKSVESTGSGVPLLSRVPVLKWLFSSRTKSRNVDKLNIFIKPTVFY